MAFFTLAASRVCAALDINTRGEESIVVGGGSGFHICRRPGRLESARRDQKLLIVFLWPARNEAFLRIGDQ